MDVSSTAWAVTMGGIALIFLLDVVIMGRRPHVVGIREAAISVLFYVGLAVAFGFGIWMVYGHQYGVEYFAGYITELSLSVDNLFVFVVIMSAFAVPQVHQLKVLQLGIIGALLLRFAFILIGAAALERFSWLFFVFGAFLLWTAWKLATSHGSEGQPTENKILIWVERVLPTTTEYHGGKFSVTLDGKRVFTPLAVGDRRNLSHRHHVRPGFDSGHLRPHPGDLHHLHGQRFRADGAAPDVFPSGWLAGQAHLSVPWTRSHPGIRRCEVDPPRGARDRP